MKVIVCIDKNDGMLFNNRRLSCDVAVVEDILKNNNCIYINNFSKEIFEKFNDKSEVIIDDNYLDIADNHSCCFVENINLLPYINKIDTIVLYNWNRDYPSDFKFNIELDNKIWKRKSKEIINGKCHKKIIKEVYTK